MRACLTIARRCFFGMRRQMSQAVSASPTVPVRRKVRKPATKREPSASARDPCRGPCRPCRCSYPGYPSCRASFRDRRPRRARRHGRPSRRSSHRCDRGRSGRRLPGCGHGRPGCGSDRCTCRSSSLCPARSWSRRPAVVVVVVWPWGTEAAVVWPLGAEVAGAVRPAEAAVGEAEAARPAEAEEAETERPAEAEEAEAEVVGVTARSAADGDSCRQGPGEEFRRRGEPSRSAGRLPR